MSDVRSIRSVSVSANAEIVERLEDLLEKAKSGEIRSITYAGTMTERRIFSGGAGDNDSIDAEIFALEVIKFRRIRDWSSE